jgi:hypothetical protein
MKANRVILDTNLWISLLITRKHEILERALNDGKIILIFSEKLLSEFNDVIKRPKFQKYFSDSEIQTLLNLIQEFSEFIEIRTTVNLCRDEKDNFLLSMCIDGTVDFLVTGDKDLLILETIDKTQIITYQNFTEQLDL